MTQIQNTLYVANRQQAAIYELEMKGQISDGRWENSSPHNHWKTPCDARVVVRPERIGRNFWHMRGYNFGEKELFELLSGRMLRYARAAIAFPEVSIEAMDEVHWDIEDSLTSPGWNSYLGDTERAVRLGAIFRTFGVNSAEEFEARMATAEWYTEKQLKRDVSGLTTCFRTKLAPETEPTPAAPVVGPTAATRIVATPAADLVPAKPAYVGPYLVANNVAPAAPVAAKTADEEYAEQFAFFMGLE